MKTDLVINQRALEQYGIDNRFLNNIGLAITGDGSIRQKQSVKIYIPKYAVELFQTLALYFKIKETSISVWSRRELENLAKQLLDNDDPMFKEARILHKELKEHQYKKLIEESEKK